MTGQRLEELLASIRDLRVGVIGDFCLDAYWMLDPDQSERSVETGRPVRKVLVQRYAIGAAGTITADLAALGMRAVHVFGVIGDDLFGREMGRLLAGLGVHVGGLIVQRGDWDTPVYGKPHLGEVEQDRIDFGGANRLVETSVEAVLAALRAAWVGLDGLIVNQQLVNGLWDDQMIAGLSRLTVPPDDRTFSREPQASASVFSSGDGKSPLRRSPPVCVIDSRHSIERFPPAIWKLNRLELARLFDRRLGTGTEITAEQTSLHAGEIFKRTGRPVFVTMGEHGSLVATADGVHLVPPVPVRGPVDPVGAGDAAMAAFTVALAAGASPVESAELANLAAAVTVTKLRQTGTASPAEILALAASVT